MTGKGAASLERYPAQLPLGAFRTPANFYVGQAAFAAKEYDKALTAFDYVVTHAPDGEFAEEALARKCEILYLNGRYDEALASFKNARTESHYRREQAGSRAGYIAHCPQQTAVRLGADRRRGAVEREQAPRPTCGKRCFSTGRCLCPHRAGREGCGRLAGAFAGYRSEYGAQSAYLLAQYQFDNKALNNAEKTLNAFIDKGTPHSYWLARGFLLMADIYEKRGENFQARQYLQSLRTTIPPATTIS